MPLLRTIKKQQYKNCHQAMTSENIGGLACTVMRNTVHELVTAL
jgi:hypothetical protein